MLGRLPGNKGTHFDGSDKEIGFSGPLPLVCFSPFATSQMSGLEARMLSKARLGALKAWMSVSTRGPRVNSLTKNSKSFHD
jgi:hypothetical protein